MSHYAKLIRDRDHIDKVLAHLQNEHSTYHSAPGSIQGAIGSGAASLSSGSSGTSIILETLRKPWIAPMDAWKAKSAYHIFGSAKQADGNADQAGASALSATTTPLGAIPSSENSNRIESLAQLQAAILATKTLTVTAKAGSSIPKRVMIPFKAPRQAFPISVPICPDAIAVEDAFGGANLHIDVHSVSGYNFTNELENVYKAKTTASTSYNDFLSTCHRALMVFEPTLEIEAARSFAVYMGRMALWERSVAQLACADALKATAPDLKAVVSDKEPHPDIKILIGRDRVDQHLCCWMRLCPRLLSNAVAKTAPADVKKAEMDAHIALHFCYYRKYVLTQSRLDEFERSQQPLVDWKVKNTFRGSSDVAPPPPPPPRPPHADSWFVYVICRQNVNLTADPDALTGGGLNTEMFYDELDAEDQLASAEFGTQALHGGGGNRFGRGDDSVATNGGEGDDESTAAMTNLTGFTDFTGFSRKKHGNGGRYIEALSSRANPSPCSELLTWGYNADFSMGIGNMVARESTYRGSASGPRLESDDVHKPRPVPLPCSLTLERIAMVACSPRHTLVLSCMGNIYVCGENTEGALGLGHTQSRSRLTLLQWPENPDDPDEVPPKISKIAAGSGTIGSHSMCLSTTGSLYGWGVPQAVGHGGLKPVLAPRLIDSFPSAVVRPHPDARAREARANATAADGDDENWDSADIIDGGATTALPCADVACGGGFTVAVLADGRVCSWGVWSHGRLGQGPTPETKAYKARGKKIARYKMRPGFVKGIKNAVSVSCGEAHALCLLRTGEVRAWGQNSCGQLGIGPNYLGLLRDMLHPVTVFPFVGLAKNVNTSAAKRSRGRPEELPTVFEEEDSDGATTVAKSGRDGDDRSVANPPTIASDGRSILGAQRLVATFVGCGAYHSAVIDSSGAVYTFGARGSFCLGHNDAYLNGEWAARTNAVFSISSNASELQIPYELLPWCKLWSRPRKVIALDGCSVKGFTGGDMHSCFLSDRGDVYICGTGPVAPPIIPTASQAEADVVDANSTASQSKLSESQTTRASTSKNRNAKKDPTRAITASNADDDGGYDAQKETESGQAHPADTGGDDYGDDDDEEEEGDEAIGSDPGDDTLQDDESTITYISSDDESSAEDSPQQLSAKRSMRQKKHDQRKQWRIEDAVAAKATIVKTPRKASATWLEGLSSKRALHIASSGTKCFVILDDEKVAPSLTAPLLRRTVFGPAANEQGLDEIDNMSMQSHRPRSDDEASFGSFFEQRGRADCLLLVSGKVLLCHKALLAVRSPYLRDMILRETPADEYSIHGIPQPTQLLLPELHVDSARALLSYLYTDILPTPIIGNSGVLRSLERASKLLRMPRLQILCERLISCINEAELAQAQEEDAGWSELVSLDLPPPTLARDLGELVGDAEYADVRFIAEGRPIHAHRFILESRCEYFRTMFRSSYIEGFGDGNSSGAATSVDVVVPDSFMCFLRLLIYLYTDTLPDGTDAALLEDLLCADRYGISDMKEVCENMLVPSTDNWLEILNVADMLRSTRLQLEIDGFVRDNFSVICPEEDFSPTGMRDNKTIAMLREDFPDFLGRAFEARLDAHPLPPSMVLMDKTMGNNKTIKEDAERPPFPTWALVTGIITFFLYTQSSKVVTLGPIIPIVNVVFVLGMLLYMFRFIFSKAPPKA